MQQGLTWCGFSSLEYDQARWMLRKSDTIATYAVCLHSAVGHGDTYVHVIPEAWALGVWDLGTALSLCLYCLSEEQPGRYGAASTEKKTIARDCTNLLLPLNCHSLNERIHPAHCKGSLGKLRLNMFLFFLTICWLGMYLHCRGPKRVTPLAVQNWD